jgi:hypothetical protein
MEKLKVSSEVSDHRLGQLKAILYLLQTNLEDFKDEVDRSYELLKIGEKTTLSKEIEHSLDNPIQSIFGLSTTIDVQVRLIIDRIVRAFIKSRAKLVASAYRTLLPTSDLHYCIVLNKDTTANRAKIFEFLDRYDLLDISENYPVIFQFVPQELAHEIAAREVIDLGN